MTNSDSPHNLQNQQLNRNLIIELVSRYSPSQQEGEAVNYLVQWMAERGFDALVDEAGNAAGMRGNPDAPNTLMLLGHIDTVKGEIPVTLDENDLLYGRGSVDAKGSLCTFAAATAQAHIPDDWRVIIVGAVEEEISTSKGAHFVRDVYRPQLCIIGEPSGAERITLGYKGRVLLKYHFERPMTHTALPEPSAGAVGAELWRMILDWSAIHNSGHSRLFDQITPHLHEINTSSDGFTEAVNMTIGFRLPPRMTPDMVIGAIQLMADDGNITPYGFEHAYQSEKNNPLVRGMLAAIRKHGGEPGFVLKSGTSDMNVVGAVWECPIIAYGPGDSQLDHTPNEHLDLAEYDLAVATLTTFIETLN